MKAEGNAIKEKAQMEADLITKEADRTTLSAKDRQDGEIKRYQIDSQRDIELRKLAITAAEKEPDIQASNDFAEAMKALNTAVAAVSGVGTKDSRMKRRVTKNDDGSFEVENVTEH